MSTFRPVACVPHRRRVWSPLKSAFVFGERVGPTALVTDNDRSALPLMCTYLSIGVLCHSGDLCLKSPSNTTTSITSDTLRSNTFPYPPRSAPHTETESGSVISPFHAIPFARKTVDLSLGRIWEHHLFSFTLPLVSQRRIILYIYEWSCLLVYTELLF